MFIVHQSPSHTLLLADSLARRQVESGADTISMNASKLVKLSDGIFAAHAGTWQPAITMLSDVAALLARPRGRPSSHKSLCASLTSIGSKRFLEFRNKWKDLAIDARIAIVITGRLRDPADIKDHFSSTILLWEAAREFKPLRVRRTLCFASTPELSRLTSDLLSHTTLQPFVTSSPLSAAQALLATHAVAAHLSDSISHAANLILIGEDKKCCVLQGQVFSLPCAALMQG